MHDDLKCAILMVQIVQSIRERGVFMKQIFLKFSSILAMLALVMTTANVNATCDFLIYQPKLPQNAKKLRKF